MSQKENELLITEKEAEKFLTMVLDEWDQEQAGQAKGDLTCSEAELKHQGKCLRMTSEEMSIAHMKVFGEIPASKEERLELMQKMGISPERAKELLQEFERLGR
jgi:hypothetical protein